MDRIFVVSNMYTNIRGDGAEAHQPGLWPHCLQDVPEQAAPKSLSLRSDCYQYRHRAAPSELCPASTGGGSGTVCYDMVSTCCQQVDINERAEWMTLAGLTFYLHYSSDVSLKPYDRNLRQSFESVHIKPHQCQDVYIDFHGFQSRSWLEDVWYEVVMVAESCCFHRCQNCSQWPLLLTQKIPSTMMRLASVWKNWPFISNPSAASEVNAVESFFHRENSTSTTQSCKRCKDPVLCLFYWEADDKP